jgi:hypothetical protein
MGGKLKIVKEWCRNGFNNCYFRKYETERAL